MCECVCYCAYFYYVNKLYVHVCVLERAKHSFFALPNPLSCSVMNKICLNQRFWIITITTIWLCYNYYFVFCSFTHLRIPRSKPNLISSSLYYPGLLHKISSQSVHNFLSNVVHGQTDKQTNQRYQNITSFAKEVKIIEF